MPTLAAYIPLWAPTTALRINPRTVEQYERSLRLYAVPALGACELTTLTRVDIRALLVDMIRRGKGRSVVIITYVALNSCLDAAVDDGLLTLNPARGAGRKLFKLERKAPRAKTRDEVALFLAVMERRRPDLFVLYLLCAETGVRLGELLGLRRRDFDLGRRRVYIARQWVRGMVDSPKHDSDRMIVDLSRNLCAHLHAHFAKNPGQTWAFQTCQHREKPWDPGTIQKNMRKVTLECGIPGMSPHVLRHTYATLTLEETNDITYVSHQLGHRSVAITANLYARSAQLRHPQAAERLDAALTRAHQVPLHAREPVSQSRQRRA